MILLCLIWEKGPEFLQKGELTTYGKKITTYEMKSNKKYMGILSELLLVLV